MRIPHHNTCACSLFRAGRYALLFILVLLMFYESGIAQPIEYREWRDSTAVEEKRAKWIGSDEYPIGVFFSYLFNRPVTEIWTYMEAINADYVLYSAERGNNNDLGGDRWDRYQTLLDNTPSGKQVIPDPVWGGSYIRQGRLSREVTFYPFDSSQMSGLYDLGNIFSWYKDRIHENVFTDYEYDTTVFNLEYLDDRDSTAPREAIYETSLANTTVASGVAFKYKDSQTERWDSAYNPTTQKWEPHAAGVKVNSTYFFEKVNFDNWEGFRAPYFIAVNGHLFPNGNAVDADTLLKINVYYEVGYDEKYYDSSDALVTATDNERFLYKTVGVTKGELKPSGAPPFNWNEYREVIKPINFEREGMGGPNHEGATAHSIDMEVIYLGGEKLALRSVALRDSIVNLLLTETQEADDYRDSIVAEIDTLVRDEQTNALRTEIHNLRINDEPEVIHVTAFKQIKQLIELNFSNFPGGDTLTTYNGWAVPQVSWLGESDWVTNGTYLGNNFAPLGIRFNFLRDSAGTPIVYKLTEHNVLDVPSVKQHNGGQWGIPLFFDFDELSDPTYAATMQDRIDTMELIWQHGKLGAAVPGEDLDDNFGGWLLRKLYESRAYAREIGRPYMEYAGIQSWFRIWCFPGDSILSIDTTYIGVGPEFFPVYDTTFNTVCDTLLDHRHERAEVRALLRLPAIYGAKGLALYQYEAAPWIKQAFDGESVVSYWGDEGTGFGRAMELGFGGWPISDTADNILDFYLFHPGEYEPNGDQTVTYDTLGVMPDLYLGFRDYKTEVHQGLSWLQQVGPVLQRLKWRDAYSIHFQADLPNQTHDDTLTHRTLPTDEILAGVRTWHPITGVVDSAWATYVEVGLYETVVDTTGGERNRLRDTNYLSILNRRVFTTENYDSADIGYSASEKALLDTLSETRVIELKLQHLVNPDTSNQYNRFVRVREVYPDTEPLPLIGQRMPLDTILNTNAGIINGEATVLLTLGAGRAALLEVTYAQPDESIQDGLLTRNNQRKMIFDPVSDRYYSVYHHFDSTLSDWHVFMRRSLPVSQSGTILWEPFESHVSDYMDDGDDPRTLNSHPSITMRYLPSGDSRISIVWTAHPNASGHPFEREVLIRDITYWTQISGSDTTEWTVAAPIRSLGYHYGLDAEEWGTPVISSASGTDVGEYVAWSDSTVGIVAQVRLLDTNIFLNNPVWTAPDTVSRHHTTAGFGSGQYPAMPPFTHRDLAQESLPIVWQQPGVTSTGISYARLDYTPPPTGSALLVDYSWINNNGGLWWISPNVNSGYGTNHYRHPSIDQSQDALRESDGGCDVGRALCYSSLCEW